MITKTINTSQLMEFQSWLRLNNMRLLRATPFRTSIDGVSDDYYHMLYIAQK